MKGNLGGEDEDGDITVKDGVGLERKGVRAVMIWGAPRRESRWDVGKAGRGLATGAGQDPGPAQGKER